MTWRTRTSQAGRVTAAAALTFAAACGVDHGHPQTSTPAAAPNSTSAVSPTAAPLSRGPGSWSVTGVDDHDPDAVLAAVAATVYTYQPGPDVTATAAFDRAKPLMSGKYIAEVGHSAQGLGQFTGTTWRRWVDERAIVGAVAKVSADDHPKDASTNRSRVVGVTQTVHPGAGGAGAEPPIPLVLYMIATRTNPDQGWRVAMISPR